MSCAIFDLDGCLSDDRWRRHKAKESWEAYHEGLMNDKAVNHSALSEHLHKGDRIIFLTARPNSYEGHTRAWIQNVLMMRAGSFDLIMRAAGDLRPSPVFKSDQVKDMLDERFNIVAAYDDREDVVEAYRALGIDAAVLDIPSQPGVAENLRKMAETYEERQATYGKSYIQFGDIATALWPSGLTLHTKAEWIRHGVLVQILSKLARYAGSGGHKDSAHDLAVYAAILEEVTDED